MFARRTRGKVLRLASATVSVAMSISLVGTLGGAAKVRAYDEYSKDKNNTRLGTSQIKAPLKGTADNSWRGSYVWFGQYDDEPIKFRVLDPDTDLYGGKTMLPVPFVFP